MDGITDLNSLPILNLTANDPKQKVITWQRNMPNSEFTQSGSIVFKLVISLPSLNILGIFTFSWT